MCHLGVIECNWDDITIAHWTLLNARNHITLTALSTLYTVNKYDGDDGRRTVKRVCKARRKWRWSTPTDSDLSLHLLAYILQNQAQLCFIELGMHSDSAQQRCVLGGGAVGPRPFCTGTMHGLRLSCTEAKHIQMPLLQSHVAVAAEVDAAFWLGWTILNFL